MRKKLKYMAEVRNSPCLFGSAGVFYFAAIYIWWNTNPGNTGLARDNVRVFGTMTVLILAGIICLAIGIQLRTIEQKRTKTFRHLQKYGTTVHGIIENIRTDKKWVYAKIKYKRLDTSEFAEFWTPALYCVPEIGASCNVYYDEQGNLYANNFSK